MAIKRTKPVEKHETKPEEKSEGVTLAQALEEEGEGRTPDNLQSRSKKSSGPSKAEQAMKIMEVMWKDIQAGKVKRKDVIHRFIDEVGLTKAGASTYYSNCKQKLEKTA